MKSSSSKILIVGGIIIGIFGLVCLVSKGKRKNVSKKVCTTQKSDVDACERKEVKSEHDEERKPAKSHRISYSTPESLMEHVLRDELKKNNFESTDDFLSNFIKMASLYCEDYSWFDYFPKSANELREALGKYGLLEQFDIQLYNKFKTK